jgi:hypothetical protein
VAEVDIHTMRCDRCGEPIELVGWQFRHCLDGARACGDGEGHARPQPLEVRWVRFGNGSEGYYLVHEGVEVVVWQHARTIGEPTCWSAWRVEVVEETPGEGVEVPRLTTYEGPGVMVPDPETLICQFPPLVAYWMRDKVFAF